MPTAFEGFKQGGSTIPVKDTTARNSITAILDGTNIDSFSDVETALSGKVDTSSLGQNSGVATLDANGKVPSSQIPAGVGTAVEGNPTEAATAGDLTKIKIDSDVYSIPSGGGGGTTVVANPTGTATADLNKVQIGTDIYDIPDTTYQSKQASSGGTDVSLVTTGEKYTWNEKVSKSQTAGLLKNDGTVNTTIEGAVTANTSAISAIKDGTDIDSFGDVESALEDKVDKVSGKGLSTNDYDNTAKGVVDNIQNNVKANTQLIKDTVGWVEKNKIPFPYDNTGIDAYGIVVKPQSDGGIKANGQATTGTGYVFWQNKGLTLKAGKWTLSCDVDLPQGVILTCEVPAGTNRNIRTNAREITFELSQDAVIANYRIWFESGAEVNNLIIHPMLRSAEILDNTYEIYHKSVETLFGEQEILGSKNVFPFKATSTGIFTVNSDDTVTVNTSGALADNVYLKCSDEFVLKAGTYVINGAPIDDDAILSFFLETPTTPKTVIASHRSDEIDKVFTINSDTTVYGVIRAYSGKTITNKIVKPMISLNGGEFAPYAKTNRELTEDVANIPTVSVTHTGTASSTGVRKQQITVNNVSYDVDGSAYMEQSVTLSTSQSTDVVFTNAIIADGTELTFSSSIWDLVPDDMVTTTGVCTVTLPKWTSAVTIGCRLRVR